MRFIQFPIVVCVLSFGLHGISCGFIGNVLREGIQTTYGFVRHISHVLPKPKEFFSFGIPINSLHLQDMGQSATDVAKGVIGKIPDVIPSPEDMFHAGKSLIAGYPFEQVWRIFNLVFTISQN